MPLTIDAAARLDARWPWTPRLVHGRLHLKPKCRRRRVACIIHILHAILSGTGRFCGRSSCEMRWKLLVESAALCTIVLAARAVCDVKGSGRLRVALMPGIQGCLPDGCVSCGGTAPPLRTKMPRPAHLPSQDGPHGMRKVRNSALLPAKLQASLMSA